MAENDKHESEGQRGEILLTDDGFDVLLGAWSAAVLFKRASRSEGEGQSFVVFLQVIVDFAGEQRGQTARI